MSILTLKTFVPEVTKTAFSPNKLLKGFLDPRVLVAQTRLVRSGVGRSIKRKKSNFLASLLRMGLQLNTINFPLVRQTRYKLSGL